MVKNQYLTVTCSSNWALGRQCYRSDSSTSRERDGLRVACGVVTSASAPAAVMTAMATSKTW